VTNITSTQSSR